MMIAADMIAPDQPLVLAADDALIAPTGRIFFTGRELACEMTGQCRLDPRFARQLIALALEWKGSLPVTSCCRSTIYNRQVGGHLQSLHVFDEPNHGALGACAIDIATPSAADAWLLARIAIGLRFSVGVPAGRFLHVDYRAGLGMLPAIFGYGK